MGEDDEDQSDKPNRKNPKKGNSLDTQNEIEENSAEAADDDDDESGGILEILDGKNNTK